MLAATYIGHRFEEYGLKYFSDKQAYGLPFKWVDSGGDTIRLYNMVGIIPGKSKPSEMIIFSAHYDHLGRQLGERDTIMNGANDNASGTTALLMLAQYFSLRNDNERTIVFCAFVGEEMGLLGSRVFASMVNPTEVIAGINLEMLGFPQYGKLGVFVDGQRYSDLPAILITRLKKLGMKIVGEPPASKMIFQRSDNFSFVLRGIPAHTISSSDDDERCYHRPCDENDRMDFSHLALVTQAIAQASADLISGKETPSRILLNDLKKPVKTSRSGK